MGPGSALEGWRGRATALRARLAGRARGGVELSKDWVGSRRVLWLLPDSAGGGAA